jgi:hypothetical protein
MVLYAAHVHPSMRPWTTIAATSPPARPTDPKPAPLRATIIAPTPTRQPTIAPTVQTQRIPPTYRQPPPPTPAVHVGVVDKSLWIYVSNT